MHVRSSLKALTSSSFRNKCQHRDHNRCDVADTNSDLKETKRKLSRTTRREHDERTEQESTEKSEWEGHGVADNRGRYGDANESDIERERSSRSRHGRNVV